MSIGQIVGVQHGQVVSVRDTDIIIGGRTRRLPLADMQGPILCPVCDQRMHTYRRDGNWFLRHPAGMAHTRQQIDKAAALRLGEGDRHHAIKTFLYDDYRLSRTWDAKLEQTTDSGLRRPDVTALPLGKRRKVSGIVRVPAALEVQESPITFDEMERRAADHRTEGMQSVWFKAATEPAPWPALASAVALTPDARVIGIANECEPSWQRRQWIDPIDLDKFTHLHRTTKLVMSPDYGVITIDAWTRHLERGITPKAPPATRPEMVPVHRSVHPDAPPLIPTRWANGYPACNRCGRPMVAGQREAHQYCIEQGLPIR